MKVAILALQGAFAEHQQMLSRLGADSVLIRNLADWDAYVHPSLGGVGEESLSLIIPGGESTTMTRIMDDEGLTAPIAQSIASGLPVFGTCAGMIMLDRKHLGVMDIEVRRNAYGRQLGSFYAEHDFEGLGIVPMTFIRAPYITEVGEGVQVLSQLDGHIIAARQGHMLVTSFHPELNDDLRIHSYFLRMIQE